jgi:protein-S-isoprenylcysteine O-methyltransferase Ste14
VTRLPDLGPRGEGWFVAQLVALIAIPWSARVDPWRPDLSADLDGAFRSLGLAISLIGLAIAAIAAIQLSRHRALTPLPRPTETGQLIETGLYGLVRHPVYSGLALFGLGLASAGASPLAAVAEVGLVAVLLLKARREELWLAARYPAYAAYQARTKRLIPRIL